MKEEMPCVQCTLCHMQCCNFEVRMTRLQNTNISHSSLLLLTCPSMPIKLGPIVLCWLLQGLKQHLEASHDLFDYSFPGIHKGMWLVNVKCADDIYNSQNEFRQPDAEALKDPVNKVDSR